MNSIEYETKLAELRLDLFHHPVVDIINEGFRPTGAMPNDFGVTEHEGRYHFFYNQEPLTESTGFFPGFGIYLGHASTANFFDWEVHEPVLLIRPGTWEEAHTFGVFVLKHQDTFILAYHGLNCYLSQDIGLASSKDLFEWERFDSNPISPAKDKAWSYWREDGIASCRDPHLFEHDGRIWMTFTANTKEGASCVAMCSTTDFVEWEDHGPILVGPTDGYELDPMHVVAEVGGIDGRFTRAPHWRGREQEQLESSYLLTKNDKWFLLVQSKFRGSPLTNFIIESDRIDSFDLSQRREFWHGARPTEIVKERGSRSLLATTKPIRFGEVDWSEEKPTAHFITSPEGLRAWQD